VSCSRTGSSALSGGYAGAETTIGFLTAYAAAESERDALGIRFVSVLPQLTPATALDGVYVAAYAARQGVDVVTFTDRLGSALTPELAGRAIADLITGPALTRMPTCSPLQALAR
jgi:hypothetical protein